MERKKGWSNNVKKKQIILQVSDIVRHRGVGDFGFADISILDKDEGRGYGQAISLVFPLSRGILSEVETEPTITYFHHYRTMNRLIDDTTLQLALFLERQGYRAYPVPASQSDPETGGYRAVFSHKTAAVLSGMGWIGKSALFIHSRYGPAVRLGTVLTDAPLGSGSELMESRCGQCTRCRDVCPAQAIEGVKWQMGMARNQLIDVRACSTHMKEAYQHIGRGVVCGLCMVHCPFGAIQKEKVQ